MDRLNQYLDTPSVEVADFVFVADNVLLHAMFSSFSGAKVGKKEIECDPTPRAI